MGFLPKPVAVAENTALSLAREIGCEIAASCALNRRYCIPNAKHEMGWIACGPGARSSFELAEAAGRHLTELGHPRPRCQWRERYEKRPAKEIGCFFADAVAWNGLIAVNRLDPGFRAQRQIHRHRVRA